MTDCQYRYRDDAEVYSSQKTSRPRAYEIGLFLADRMDDRPIPCKGDLRFSNNL